MKNKTKLKNVLNVIKKWQKDNNVAFWGGFMEFDKKGDVIEDRLICYGTKEVIKISLEEFNKLLSKDKSKFINW